MRHAELWTNADLLRDWQTVADLAKSYPLGYALHFPNKLDKPPEVLAGAVGLYRALDARALVLHQTHMDRHGAALLRLDPGIRLAVENHRVDSIDGWANSSPGLALDVEHLWMYNFEGRPLGEVLAEMPGRLRSDLGSIGDDLREAADEGRMASDRRKQEIDEDMQAARWGMDDPQDDEPGSDPDGV